MEFITQELIRASHHKKHESLIEFKRLPCDCILCQNSNGKFIFKTQSKSNSLNDSKCGNTPNTNINHKVIITDFFNVSKILQSYVD